MSKLSDFFDTQKQTFNADAVSVKEGIIDAIMKLSKESFIEEQRMDITVSDKGVLLSNIKTSLFDGSSIRYNRLVTKLALELLSKEESLNGANVAPDRYEVTIPRIIC